MLDKVVANYPPLKLSTGDQTDMGKVISAVKTQGAMAIGRGVVLKMLTIALGLIGLAVVVVAKNA